MSTYSSILLEETDHGWVATHREREIASAACPTREEALDDLDEQIALEDGDLELSDDAEAALEATADEYDRGETTSLDDLRESVEN
jgi:hypothetical protein